MAVESHEEKPDWNSWPSIVKWAAQLDRGSPAAKMIARGAPVGPPLGVDIAPEDVRRGPLTAAPEDEPLTVVSGYLDDRRQFVGPGHHLYPAATYAYAYRNFWTDREHRDYWRTHLHLWPSRKGRRQDRESLAFAIVNADELGVPREAFLASLGYSRDDLRDRNVLDLADRMQAELEAGPSDVRAPMVVTDEELDRMPYLTSYQTLDAREGGATAKVGRLARDVLIRGAAEAAALRETW